VHTRDAAALKQAGIEFNCNFIFGGQIRGEGMRLFQIYAAGNFIEATPESLYIQIGESKYGKPIIDRVVQPATPLGEAAKCALISMDSTLRSNISVGLPLDPLVYEVDALRVTRFVLIDHNNPYQTMIRNTWGARLKQVFGEIPDPTWHGAGSAGNAAIGDRAHNSGARAAAGKARFHATRCTRAAEIEICHSGESRNPVSCGRPKSLDSGFRPLLFGAFRDALCNSLYRIGEPRAPCAADSKIDARSVSVSSRRRPGPNLQRRQIGPRPTPGRRHREFAATRNVPDSSGLSPE